MQYPKTPRGHLQDTLTAFLDHWSGEKADHADMLFADAVQFHSSHRGNAYGREAVATLLATDLHHRCVTHITASNEVVRLSGRQGMIGAYFFGELRDPGAPTKNGLFGGLLVLKTCMRDDVPFVHDIRIQMNWVQGDTGLLADWALPVRDRTWKPGDRAATIVSELDAPWQQPDSDGADDDESPLADVSPAVCHCRQDSPSSP